MDRPSTMSHRQWKDLAVLILLIGATDWLSLMLALGPGELTAVWIGNGILGGWLLSRPTSLWPGYIAGGLAADFLAHLLTGYSVAYGLALAVSNIVEVLIVAGGIRRMVGDVGDPKRWITLGVVATGSTLIACAVSGVLAAMAITATSGGSFLTHLLTWYAAHVVGMVIVGTFTLVALREGLGLVIASGKRGSFVGTMLLLVLVALAAFSSPYPVLFLPYLPLLFGAFRHGFAGVTVGVVLLALIGSIATAMGQGPLAAIANIAPSSRIALLQLYIAAGCLMTIPVALAMAEHKRLTQRLRDSQQRYKMLADYSHDVVVRMRANGERLYVSPSAKDMLGWEADEMLGTRWSLVHPEDRDRQADAMAQVIASGEPKTEVYRVRHKDGHYVWVEAVTRPIPSADREGEWDIIYAGRNVTRRIATEHALEESRRELERLARTDTLTGLANRRQFDERLSLAILRLRRHEFPIALLYLDIDHFKTINDKHGHAIGDGILCAFAQRLLDNVRATDLVARLGGDEFVVIVDDAALPDAAETIARKLIETMTQPMRVEGRELKVTTSIGIAYTHAPVDARTLMSCADAALYAAKEAGRNTYCMKSLHAGAANQDTAEAGSRPA